MTRIRRNWSSSRGAEVPEAPPRLCHVVVADGVEIDAEGEAASPTRLQLVDEEAALAADEEAALAAVSLKSLEHDEAGFQILKHETRSFRSKIWERLLFGGGLLRHGRSENSSPKLFDDFGPDPGCAFSGGVSSMKERVDEIQPRSSPAALDEVDSCVAAGVEPVAVVMGFKDEQGLLQADRQEIMVGGDGPPLVQRLVSWARTGRKKRQRPWYSDSDFAVTLTDIDKKVTRDRAINNEDIARSAWNFKPKSEKITHDNGMVDRVKSKIGMMSDKVSLNGRNNPTVQPEKDTLETAANRFPSGWKYRGLAQIAEVNIAARAPEDRCGRTDGRLWQCPLKRKQGSSLCEHHLNKFRLKKMYKTRRTARIQKPDSGSISPKTSDSTLKPYKVLDYDTDARTRFRRRYKTAKLSIL